MIKTPAETRQENYCDVHGIYFNRVCEDCQWDQDRTELELRLDGRKTSDNWIPLERVDA